jgi:hypothetical protein
VISHAGAGCHSGLRGGELGLMGYIGAGISPVRFRLVFWTFFIFSNIGSFVFRFVFSTGTCFQQLLRFVFGLFRFVFLKYLLLSATSQVCFQK